MKLPESEFKKLPPHLQKLFKKLPNQSSQQVLDLFPESASGSGGRLASCTAKGFSTVTSGPSDIGEFKPYSDAGKGSAARFFYQAKANKHDRAGSKHPTVKPVSLMRWLVRMVTPPGGTILDPFAGSGTTGQAAIEEGFNPVLIERENEYVQDIQNRMKDKCDVELLV